MFWVLVFIFVLVFGLVLLDRSFKNEEFEKIPGPKGVFLFGNSFQFLTDAVRIFYSFRNLSNVFKQLYKFQLGPMKFVIVINPEDVESVIAGSKNTKKGYLYRFLKPWLNDGLLLSDGEKWHQRRRVLTPAFHFNVLNHYKTIFDESSKTLVENLKLELDSSEVDITKYASECTLNAICETAMGVKLDSHSSEDGKQYKKGILLLAEQLLHRVQRVWLHLDSLYAMSSAARDFNRILNRLSSFRDNVIKKRKDDVPQQIFDTNQEDDDNVYKKGRLAMLDLLFQAEKEGLIDRQGICEEVDTFMFEGHDTTATALQYTLMLLANHPAVQDKIVQEIGEIFGTSERSPTNEDLKQMKYLECCIKESLRLYPPVYFFLRQLDEDVKLKHYTIPAKTDCCILLYDLHRKADQFVEPQEFRPERFAAEPTWHPYAYIPFSAGPRNCIGQRFAMMEMKIVVSTLLRHYRFLPVTKPDDIFHVADFILRTNKPIYVKIERI